MRAVYVGSLSRSKCVIKRVSLPLLELLAARHYPVGERQHFFSCGRPRRCAAPSCRPCFGAQWIDCLSKQPQTGSRLGGARATVITGDDVRAYLGNQCRSPRHSFAIVSSSRCNAVAASSLHPGRAVASLRRRGGGCGGGSLRLVAVPGGPISGRPRQQAASD